MNSLAKIVQLSKKMALKNTLPLCYTAFKYLDEWTCTGEYVNFERTINMALAEVAKTTTTTITYTIDDAMDVMLSKLDEAIDDMENGRIQTLDEAWGEIDRV
jgi:hypothetical protein